MKKVLKRPALALGLATALMTAIGALDYFTGQECQVVALYLLPVSLVVWVAGRRWGMAFSLLSACTWLAAEVGIGGIHARQSSLLWNALMFLTVFLMVALLLSALHDMMNSLERRVRLRTSQLREEMTRRHDADLARLRAERLAQVGTMAAQVAHEVRNPLGAISLNLDLLACEVTELADGIPTPASHTPYEALTLVEQIRAEVDRVEKVVRDYLGFARLPKVMPAPHSLHAFLDEKLALLLPELGAAHVRLIKSYDPRVHTANIDVVQLWQVLLNLVLNARDAMPEGGVLRVTTRQTGTTLQIGVIDTGCGIRTEDLPSLFTPFFTTKAKGTGLGLALSQQIIAEHNGELSCQSVSGTGTTFTITLPYMLDETLPTSAGPSSGSLDHFNPRASSSHELHAQPSPAC
ncbi:ATP-binding protein [Verrucomicrobium sp. BvORR034]|uniref:sensor histidine kinase n=1 Tax=Verrucomicrobium sp. BvORR034 TaxID=1396418 RepID=UPI00224103AE|nr:ATP-binding protein [Verrucomicrobium sp. BvORR034]